MLEVYGISVDLPSSHEPLPTRASKDANDGAAGDTMEDDASDAGSDDYAYESMDEVVYQSWYLTDYKAAAKHPTLFL